MPITDSDLQKLGPTNRRIGIEHSQTSEDDGEKLVGIHRRFQMPGNNRWNLNDDDGRVPLHSIPARSRRQ